MAKLGVQFWVKNRSVFTNQYWLFIRMFCCIAVLGYFTSDIQSQTRLDQDTLIGSGELWHYSDDGTINVEDLPIPKAQFSRLLTGTSPLGYGQDDEATIIAKVGKRNKERVTQYYFHKTIDIEDTNNYETFLLRLVRDDGIVVYINNREVVRANLPEGRLTAQSLASTRIEGLGEYSFNEYFISPSYFQAGENLVSIILFQYRASSSDCRFDLELHGYTDYKLLNNLIQNINSERQLLKNEQTLYEVKRLLDEKTDELKFLDLKHSTNKSIYLIIIGLLGLATILLLGVLMRLYKKNNSKVLTHRLLEEGSEEKSKELINLSLSLLKVKQFISSISEDLQKIHKGADASQRMQIEKMMNRIEFHKHYEEDWERLKMHFDTIHSGFFARLKSAFPELTQTELRHCAYIKLQMFTSEIAQILNIDNKSVQASRYRIKKKMQLAKDVDLKNFIEEF